MTNRKNWPKLLALIMIFNTERKLQHAEQEIKRLTELSKESSGEDLKRIKADILWYNTMAQMIRNQVEKHGHQ